MDSPTLDGLADFEAKRTRAYAGQLQGFLKKWLVDDYPARAARLWQRDYSSIDAFLESVEPNRDRWKRVVKPPKLEKTGDLERTPWTPLADAGAAWLTLPLDPPLTAEGLLAVPAGATEARPAPLVIAQHGIGSWPERTFGLLDEGNHYHRYARDLLDSGFAVLAPMNLRYEAYADVPRLCQLAGMSLPGIQMVRMQRLLDEVLEDPRIDAQRVGMWGISWGGLAVQFWMPLEPRIKAGISCAFFNHRRHKMAAPANRYSPFTTDHAFFSDWLVEFSDADAVSLICPRPFMVQHGKQDGIGYWPGIVEEFEAARGPYAKLGIPERIEMDLHEGGHEISIETGITFLTRWLDEKRV